MLPCLPSAVRAAACPRHLSPCWTFAGSGRFSGEVQGWRRPVIHLTIKANPLATPGCPWHGAVFERLFATLTATQVSVLHPRCEAKGNDCCEWTITGATGSRHPARMSRRAVTTDRIAKIARHKRGDDGSHARQCRNGGDQVIPQGRQETAVRLVEGRQHPTEELVAAHMHLLCRRCRAIAASTSSACTSAAASDAASSSAMFAPWPSCGLSHAGIPDLQRMPPDHGGRVWWR